jgi:hypothetical protein
MARQTDFALSRGSHNRLTFSRIALTAGKLTPMQQPAMSQG